MPDAPENEVEVAELVRSIEAGEDKIELPEELVVEPERAADAPPQGTLQARIITMNPSEKIKLALRGNRDARMILIRDGNKMIRRFVLSRDGNKMIRRFVRQNPRTSDSEVISLARNKNADNELLQIVTQHREWMRNYQV